MHNYNHKLKLMRKMVDRQSCKGCQRVFRRATLGVERVPIRTRLLECSL